MRLTKSQLRKIIKEELETAALEEQSVKKPDPAQVQKLIQALGQDKKFLDKLMKSPMAKKMAGNIDEAATEKGLVDRALEEFRGGPDGKLESPMNIAAAAMMAISAAAGGATTAPVLVGMSLPVIAAAVYSLIKAAK